MGARGIVAVVFDSYKKMRAFVRDLRAVDLGISINISALADRAAKCCGECVIAGHGVEYSLGFQGRTDRLPAKEALELSTMRGHETISFGLAAKMLERVRTGRRTPEEAARTLARFYVCSIFLPSRDERILRGRDHSPGGKGPGPLNGLAGISRIMKNEQVWHGVGRGKVAGRICRGGRSVIGPRRVGLRRAWCV